MKLFPALMIFCGIAFIFVVSSTAEGENWKSKQSSEYISHLLEDIRSSPDDFEVERIGEGARLGLYGTKELRWLFKTYARALNDGHPFLKDPAWISAGDSITEVLSTCPHISCQADRGIIIMLASDAYYDFVVSSEKWLKNNPKKSLREFQTFFDKLRSQLYKVGEKRIADAEKGLSLSEIRRKKYAVKDQSKE